MLLDQSNALSTYSKVIENNNYLLTGKKVSLFYRNELEVSYYVQEFIEVTKVTRFTG